MLMPKRVKYRRVQRGRLKGKATSGNKVTNGSYGLVALEPAWITSNQIEAARIAMTRYIKRGGKVWIYKGEILAGAAARVAVEQPKPPRSFDKADRRDRRDRRDRAPRGERRDSGRKEQ